MMMHRYPHNLKSWSTALTCGLPGLPEPVADPEIARIAAGFRTDALSPKGSRLTLDRRRLTFRMHRFEVAAFVSRSLVRLVARLVPEQVVMACVLWLRPTYVSGLSRS